MMDAGAQWGGSGGGCRRRYSIQLAVHRSLGRHQLWENNHRLCIGEARCAFLWG